MLLLLIVANRSERAAAKKKLHGGGASSIWGGVAGRGPEEGRAEGEEGRVEGGRSPPALLPQATAGRGGDARVSGQGALGGVAVPAKESRGLHKEGHMERQLD